MHNFLYSVSYKGKRVEEEDAEAGAKKEKNFLDELIRHYIPVLEVLNDEEVHQGGDIASMDIQGKGSKVLIMMISGWFGKAYLQLILKHKYLYTCLGQLNKYFSCPLL